MKYMYYLLFFLIAACSEKKNTSTKNPEKNVFDFGIWITAKKNKTDAAYLQEFQKYKNAGIDEVLINTETNPQVLEHLVRIAQKVGISVHAWIMAVNRPGDKIALQHPEWYMVSREGNSCFDKRPYVDYYQWLCPTRKESRNHILSLVQGLAKVKGIESVHLDYIRFPDIFLPVGLLPQYNLKQEEELPAFDFCYCEVCISEFEKIHHKNPQKSNLVSLDMEWKNFRLNRIRDLVNDAYKIVSQQGKRMTAAVFPYPEMADHMVRQRWDQWDIDEVYPMLYYNFYNEESDWIGYAIQQGVADLRGKKTQLNAGIYLQPFTSQKMLEQVILDAKNNGAKGVCFFDGDALKSHHIKAIQKMKMYFMKNKK